jgi:hypothetical protein
MFFGLFGLANATHPDPLVARIFQWTLYSKTLEAIPATEHRYGIGLVEHAVQSHQPHLAVLGLRNIRDAGMEDQTETFAFGMLMDTMISQVQKVKTLALRHNQQVLTHMVKLDLHERLTLRKGLIHFNVLVCGLLNSTAFLRGGEGKALLLRVFRDLKISFGSVQEKNLLRSASPLREALVDLFRAVQAADTVDVLKCRESLVPLDRSAVVDFLHSSEYQNVVPDIAMEISETSGEDRWTEEILSEGLFGDILNLLESGEDGLETEERREFVQDALFEASMLFDEGDLISSARSLTEIRSALSLVIRSRGKIEQKRRLLEAVKMEFYRMMAVLSSRALDPLRIIGFTDSTKSLNLLIVGIMRKLQHGNLDWIHAGDQNLHAFWVKCYAEFQRLLLTLSPEKADLFSLVTDLKDLVEAMETLFLPLS